MTQTQNQKPVDNRNASQKIQDLENAMMQLYQTVDAMARDLGTVKEAIKLLGNKVDSIVKASSKGEVISDDVISRIMIENNCEELKQKVTVMQAQGILVAQEQVGTDSFVVGAELNDKDETVNPRLQFALYVLSPELQEKIKGSKVGDVLTLQEGKLRFKVLESYQIQQPKTAETAVTADQVASTEQAATGTQTVDTEASAVPAANA